MSRYQSRAGLEGEFEPGSRGRVLRNKLGIRSVRAMDRAEYEALVAMQDRYAMSVGVETAITADLICEMHGAWLAGIYAWAGRYRSVEMSKGGFVWPPARLVARNMDMVNRDTLLHLTPCRHTSIVDTARSMAEVQAELLMVHPFRDGNGRLARWVTDLMAMQSGFLLPDYQFTGRGNRARRKR
jgi:cell filamentation protein